jgi:DNA-binding transcriptional MerR regulator
LESQLGGMGTAFSSSLLGLAGSLIVGLLALFAGHGQGRFYRELEEWLSSMTRVGVGGEEGMGAAGVMTEVVDAMAEQMEGLQRMFTQSDLARAQTDRRLGDLVIQIGELARKIEERDSVPALSRISDGQERMIAALERLGAQMAEGGSDPESRMRLRSIDVQMLRILEEISAGRQETMAELRAELATLGRSLRGVARTGTDPR